MKKQPKEESFDLAKQRYPDYSKRQKDQEIKNTVKSKNAETWTWKHYLQLFKQRYVLKYKVAPMDLSSAKNRSLITKMYQKNENDSESEGLEKKKQLKSQIEFLFTHWDYIRRMLKINSVIPSVGILYSYNASITGLQSIKIDEIEELDLLDNRMGNMEEDEEYRKFMES